MTRKGLQKKHNQGLISLLSELMPAIHFLLLFCCSSIAAWLLYGLLSSTGVVTSKGFQLGGAAAGFVVIFWVSHRILRSLLKQHRENIQTSTIAEQQERISKLEGIISHLQSGELPPVICPENFVPFVSRDNGIALACPTEWEPIQERTVASFIRPINEEVAKLGFRGNIFVTSTPLDEQGTELLESLNQGNKGQKLVDLALQLPALNALKFLKGDEPSVEPFPVGPKRGIRCRSFYPRKEFPGQRNYFDCITVIDEEAGRFFIFALHECEELAEDSREILLQVVSSATFLS